MNLLDRLGMPFVAGSLFLATLSPANANEFPKPTKEYVLDFTNMIIQTRAPSKSAVWKTENGKIKGACNVWYFDKDEVEDLVVCYDIPKETIKSGIVPKKLTNGVPPSQIILNYAEPETLNTNRGDACLERQKDGTYEEARYIKGAKDV